MPPAKSGTDVQTEITAKISQGLMQAMRDKEAELDREIERLDNLGEDDLEVLRQKRRLQLKAQTKRKADFVNLGHGQYTEVHDEMQFFEASKNSAKVICHFYKPDTNIARKEIVDKHLFVIAQEILDIRFLCANVERLPFITSRLRISVLPSVMRSLRRPFTSATQLIFIKEQKMFHTMVGFEELGRTDDFKKEDLINVFKTWGMLVPYEPDWKSTREEIIEDPDAIED